MRLNYHRFKVYLYTIGIFINLQIRLSRKNKGILIDLQDKSERNLQQEKQTALDKLRTATKMCYILYPAEGGV